MTSWFIGVKASVISGAPLYSKTINHLFPVGKRQVLFAKRSYIEKFGFEPVPRQQKSDQPKSIAFFSMVGRQGFSLLRRRPLRRFAPCALRWQTLTRLLSSAPRRVRTHALATKKSGRHPPVAFLFYGGPSGVRTLDLGIKSPLLCQLS